MQHDMVVPTNAYTNKDTIFLKKCLCALRDSMGGTNRKRGWERGQRREKGKKREGGGERRNKIEGRGLMGEVKGDEERCD